eukprot:54394-Heterocapsa_arctica.AAC.1
MHPGTRLPLPDEQLRSVGRHYGASSMVGKEHQNSGANKAHSEQNGGRKVGEHEDILQSDQHAERNGGGTGSGTFASGQKDQ